MRKMLQQLAKHWDRQLNTTVSSKIPRISHLLPAFTAFHPWMVASSFTGASKSPALLLRVFLVRGI
jgi:hypothetical protein